MGEVIFQGRVPLVLDAKHRVTVPARYRDVLKAVSGDELTLARRPGERCLIVFPRAAWRTFASQLLKLPMEADRWRRLIFSSALDVEMDAASRVLLPPEMRAMAGLDKDLMMVGNGTKLELWDAATFLEQEARTAAEAMPDVVKGMVL